MQTDTTSTSSARESHSSQSMTDDVKLHLYETLKERGVIDSLKSQIRHRLISELTKKRKIAQMTLGAAENEELTLFQKAANSLVLDYLTRARYEYTLSVFVPEAGVSSDKMYSAKELLSLLQLSPESAFFKHLEGILRTQGQGFLWSFLKAVTDHCSKTYSESIIQTDRCLPVIPLSEKMNRIDSAFDQRRRKEEEAGRQAFEDRLISYQRELDKRMQRELQHEMNRFRESELAKLRLAERETVQQQLESRIRELEADHRTKLASLSERERLSMEASSRAQEAYERDSYLRRQSLLEEIDAVREQENQLRRERDQWGRERQLLQEKYRDLEDNLASRERRVKEAELAFESRLQQEANRLKMAEEMKYVQKWKELELTETRVQEQARLVENEKDSSRKLREDLLKRQSLLNEMEIIDYPTLKSENLALKKEMEELKLRLVDVRTQNETEKAQLEANLREQLTVPPMELLAMQEELEHAREVLAKEQSMWRQQRGQLERHLEAEITQNRSLTERYEQQGSRLHQLHNELGDLRHHFYISELGTTAGWPDSVRSMGDSPRRRKGGSPSHRHHRPQHHRQEERAGDESGGSSSGAWDRMVEATKVRLRNLDDETDHLQQTYRDMQLKLTGGGEVGYSSVLPLMPEACVPQHQHGGGRLLQTALGQGLGAGQGQMPRKDHAGKGPFTIQPLQPDPVQMRPVQKSFVTTRDGLPTTTTGLTGQGSGLGMGTSPPDKHYQWMKPGEQPGHGLMRDPVSTSSPIQPRFGSPRHSTGVTFHLPESATSHVGEAPRGDSHLHLIHSPPQPDSNSEHRLGHQQVQPEPITEAGGTSRDLGSTAEHLGPRETGGVASQPETMLSLDETFKSEQEPGHGHTSDFGDNGSDQSSAEEVEEDRGSIGWQASAGGQGQAKQKSRSLSASEEEEESDASRESSDVGIDPVMRQYMEMVKTQKSDKAAAPTTTETTKSAPQSEGKLVFKQFLKEADKPDEGRIVPGEVYEEDVKSGGKSESESFW